MRRLKRFLISVSAYISLFFLAMVTSGQQWPGWLGFLYCFGLPLLIVKLIWYAVDNNLFSRIRTFVKERRGTSGVQIIQLPEQVEDETESAPVEEPSGEEEALHEETCISEEHQEPTHISDKEHEYRLLLQKYRAKLDSRRAELDDRERDLSDREHTLELEKKNLAARERRLAAREEQFQYRLCADDAIERMEEYKQQLDRAELKVLDWVKRREADEITYIKGLRKESSRLEEYLNSIPQMSGGEFDSFVAEWLEKAGYRNIDIVQDAQDFNTDILAYLKTIKYVFRCVYSSDPIGVSFVQSAFCAKSIHSANVGVAVTNSIFTKEARIYADEVGIILWDGENVIKMANTSGGDY